jgi:16S rRNA (adenine1518-N6/adenine1519-N6)-dimethyltransferase
MPRGGFRPKKGLGQHFLDSRITGKILARAGFGVSDRVLEIGPGHGALTLPLARRVGQVVAVEKDRYLVESLQRRLSSAGLSNVTIINDDFLLFDLRKLVPESSKKIQIIGNLPYYITSPVLHKLIENRGLIARAVLMLQLEVAARLTASAGGKAYGAITLLVRYHAKAAPLLEVSKEAFYPRPKVDSMVIELNFEEPYPCGDVNPEDFKRVVRGAFAHRRKTLINSLKGSFPAWSKEMLLKVMEECEIDPKRRAETLTVDQFLGLASALRIDKSLRS